MLPIGAVDYICVGLMITVVRSRSLDKEDLFANESANCIYGCQRAFTNVHERQCQNINTHFLQTWRSTIL